MNFYKIFMEKLNPSDKLIWTDEYGWLTAGEISDMTERNRKEREYVESLTFEQRTNLDQHIFEVLDKNEQ